MDKQAVAYTHHGVLGGLEKEGNPGPHYHMDEP